MHPKSQTTFNSFDICKSFNEYEVHLLLYCLRVSFSLIADFGVDTLVKLATECTFPWLLSNVLDNLNDTLLAEGKASQLLECQGKKVESLFMYLVMYIMFV